MFPFTKRNRFGAWVDSEERFSVHIRCMKPRDMLAVLDIENDTFEFPWSEEDFVRHLRQRNCICTGLVAEHDDRVVAFMIYELHQTRPWWRA